MREHLDDDPPLDDYDVTPDRGSATGDYELEERQALRRVAGLSTELEDVTEVEYRQVRLERVVLAGVWTAGHRARRRAQPRGAGAARRDGGLRGARGRHPAPGHPRPGHVPRVGQGPRAARDRRRDRRRHRHLRRRADSRPAAPARGDRQGQGRRPHVADPRHLRPARAQPGGQGAGQPGADAVPAAPPARLGRVAVAPGRRRGRRRRRRRRRWRGHARPGRDEDRDRSPADPHADVEAAPAAEGDGGVPHHPAGRAPPRGHPGRRHRRLHQRGQVERAQPHHGRGSARRERAVRDAGPDRAQDPHAQRARLHARRHRRLRPAPAAPAGRGVPVHARGGPRRRPHPARRRRLR